MRKTPIFDVLLQSSILPNCHNKSDTIVQMYVSSPHYIEHAAIDRLRWDNCIQKAANSLPYAYSWYLDAISPNWDALITSDYSAVMPLTWKKKYGVRYLHQPFFAQQLGIFAQVPPDPTMIALFLAAVPTHFRYLDFYLNYANFCPILPVFTTNRRVNYILSLNDMYDRLYVNYRNNVRGHLKKARQNSFPIVSNINTTDIVNLYQSSVGAKIPNLKDAQYQLLTNLTQLCVSRNMAQTFGIYNLDNELIAAVFLIKTPNRLINLISAGNNEARKLKLMFKIMDSIIQQYAKTDTVLDFEGSMIENIADFYRGFGAKETYYWHLLKNNLPTWLRWTKNIK